MPIKINTVDEYVASLSPEAGAFMSEARELIALAVPDVKESIGYGMPRFSVNGTYLLYVGAWKSHLGFYPIPVLDDKLEVEISAYRSTKDTVRFMYKDGLPHQLIGRMVVEVTEMRISE